MKLSVAAYRASVSNVNRHISHPVRQQHQRQHTATSFTMSRSVSWGSNHQLDVAGSLGPFPSSSATMVDGSNSGPNSAPPSIDLASTVTFSPSAPEAEKCQQTAEDEERRALLDQKPVSTPRPHRSRGNQRWMKLRTTVQLSSAVASAVKDKKPPLKREDSFLKRFSTRQIAEAQDTVDGDGNCIGDGGGESARRRRRRRREGPLTVINPDENFYFIWLTVLTVCVLYNCWTLIVRQAFPELQTGYSVFWYVGDAFSDFIFFCDILLQFRTGYLEQGLMVYDSKKLAKHYMSSRAFGLDLASMLPLDLIQLFLGVNPIVRFPRFLKVYRSYNYYYMVESRTLYPNLWRVVNLIHVLLLLAHWFGCFYYLLSEAEGFRGHWVYPTPKEDFATLTRKYLGSLYWSTLTLTTIGDLPTPETDWEREKVASVTPLTLPRRGHKSRLLYLTSNGEYLFTIVSYLIGVFIFATIVGQVGNVITNRNASRLEFERLLDGAKLYMRQHKVPRDMQRRVQRWYDYSWSRGRMQGGGDINSALGILPDKLKTELALHVNLNTLKKVSIFQECQPEFLHDLVLKMKAYIFTPGDLICRKGEVAREMFIIADGILEVISEIGKVLTTMRAGDFFGEIGILNLDGLNKRTADVRSVGYSELFSLSREDILTAMKDYPEAQEILQSLGRKRLMEAKMAAAGIKKDTDSDSRKGSSSCGKDSTGDGESAINRAVQMVRRLKRDASGIRDFIFRRKERPRKQVKIELEPMPQSPEEDTIDADVECEEMRLSDTTFGRRFPWNRRLTDEEKQAKKMRLIRAKSTRGILTRMQRVNSQSEPPDESPPTPVRLTSDMAAAAEAPLGAGLPLLHRLHLLKEKQTRESLQQHQQQQPQHSQHSLQLQPSHVPTAPPPDQPLGAGLPLLKRLKLLREKEEREQKERNEGGDKMAAVSPMVLTPCAPEAMGSGLPLFHRLRRLKERDDVEMEGKVSAAKAVLLKKLETLREEEKSACDSVEKSRSFFEEEWPTNKEKSRANNGGDISESGKMSVKVMLHHPAPATPSPSPSPPATTVQVPPSSASETTTTQIKIGEFKLTAKKSGWQAFKAAVMKQPTPPDNKLVGDDKKDVVDGDSEDKADTEEKVPLTSLKVKLDKSVPNNVSKTPHSLFDATHPQKQMDFKPEEYLADLLVGVKQVLQARLEDIQNQFKSRLVSLEEEVKRKDIIIKRLEEALHHGDTTADSGPHSATPPPPTAAEDVTSDGNRSSLEDACQVLSKSPSGDDDDEDDYFEDEFEEASDVTHPGYVSHPRRSWPLLPPWSRGSERHSQRQWESQAALDIDPEQLWRVEFPAGEGDAHSRHWTLLPQQDLSDEDEETHERTASQASDNVFDTEDVQNLDDDRIGGSGNDWEIKMLAEELLKQDSRTESESSQGAKGDAKDDAKSDCKDKGCSSDRKRTLRVEDSRRREEFGSHSSIKCAQDHVVLEEEEEEEEDNEDGDGGDDQVPRTTDEESGGHGLLGVLQQLSPTERRELERLLEVATRRHLSRQMSLQVQQDHQPLPHQRSLGDQNGVRGNGVRRRMSADPSAWSLPLSLFPPAPPSAQSASGGMDGSAEVVNGASHPIAMVTEQCFFEDENPRREIPTIALLSPPPGDEDTVSICIPECEPLLGPKQQQ